MTAAALVLRYAVFAVLATAANLAVQRLVLAVAGRDSLAGEAGYIAALLAGTGAGLVVKYVLDKHWIFFDGATGMAAHGRTFTLYTLTGMATTLIFWGTETAFWLAWGTDAMREAGAMLGLAIGYALKYQLDRRFVFRAVPVGAGGAA